MIKQVLENQQLTLLSQRVRLDVKVDDLTLYADRGKLRLILENLLSNAIKYSPRGGSIHVRAHADGEVFVLDVADSGRAFRRRIEAGFSMRSTPASPRRAPSRAPASASRW